MKHRRLLLVAAVLLVATVTPSRAASLIRDAEIEGVLRDMAAPVFAAAGYEPTDVDILIVRASGINAFATGGNHILIHSGLIEAIDDYRVLLAVIAHETVHLADRHIARRTEQLDRTQSSTVLMSALALLTIGAATGDPGGAIGGFELARQVGTRSFLKYTRTEEFAADAGAVTYLEASGVDPTTMLELLDLLQAGGATIDERDSYAHTHPLPRERIQALERRVANSPHAGSRPDPDLAARFARARSKLRSFLSHSNEDPASGDTEPELLERAVALHLRGDLVGALDAANRLLSIDPANPYNHELKGQILFESGEVENALPPYRSAVQLGGEEPLLVAGLAQVLLATESGAADAEARALLEKVVEEDSLDANARRLLARAYARTGDEQLAALTTAEERLIRGDPVSASRFAMRAKSLATEGSSVWHRAQDILVTLGLGEGDQ